MRILYTHFREFSVYPGHPITIALEIMLFYERDLDKAFAPCFDENGNAFGYCEAVGNSEISGAGGNVRLAVDLLRRLKNKEMSPAQAIEWGMETWESQTKIGGDCRDKFEAGQEQAERMTWPLLDQIYRAIAEGKL